MPPPYYERGVNHQVQSAMSVLVEAVRAVVPCTKPATAQEHVMKATVQDRFGSPDMPERRGAAR